MLQVPTGRLVAWIATPLLTCALATGQNFNLDVGIPPGPSAGYGAAAAQTGTWFVVPVVTTPTTLSDVNGAVTAATITLSGGANYSNIANLPGASIDDISFMSDILDAGTVARTWTISGLADGDYAIYTYAMAPDSPAYLTDVSVAGSVDPTQSIGGAWPSGFVLGTTHAVHHVSVIGGAPVVVTVAKTPSPPAPTPNFASVNGFQIVQIGGGSQAFCFGDGTLADHTTPCPCGNNGAPGRGCANSVNAAGALLTGSGTTNPDTIVLAGSGMPATVACIYLQGDGLDDAVFGDGVRCTGGTLLRLRTRVNVGGASTFPDSTDTVTLSVRGGVTPGSGAVRHYQTYYRNSAALFCPPETFNVTNGWTITW